MGWWNTISQYAGKIKNKGIEAVGKVKTGVMSAVGKVKHTIHDIRGFVDKVKKFAPIATDIVDTLSDFVPGVSVAKHAINRGLHVADKVGSYTDSVAKTVGGTESFIENPSAQSFRDIFGD